MFPFKNRQLLPPWTSAETSHHMNKIKTVRKKLQKKGLCTSEKLKKLTEDCDQLQTKDRVDYEQRLFASRQKIMIFQIFEKPEKSQFTASKKI